MTTDCGMNTSATLPVLDSLLQAYPGVAYRCLNDEHWTIEYISAGIETLAGYRRERFLAERLRFADIIHADDRSRVQEEIAKALNAGRGFALAYRIVAADGAIRFVNEHGNAIRGARGDVVALQGFVTDVSATHELRLALDQVTERFRWIAQATNDVIWDWDVVGRQLWHGGNVRNTFALPTDGDAPGGESWGSLIHPDDREWVLAGIEAAVAGGDRDWSAEYRLQRRDGSYAEVLDRACILRGAAGEALRVVGGVSDLTERRQSKLHLDRLYRTLRIMKECNERLVRATDEHGFVGAICQMVVETAGYAAASIELAGNDASQPCRIDACCVPDAGATPPVYTAVTGASGDGPADGPAALAVSSGRPVVCDTQADATLHAGACAGLAAQGHRSGIWLPLQHDRQHLGVLSVCSSSPAPFDAEEAQLLQTLADSIAFGIDAIRSHEKRRRIESAAVRIAAAVSPGTGAGFFPQFARNMALAVDADGAFVARFQDDDLQAVRTVAGIVDGAEVPDFDYKIAGSPCELLVRSPECVVLDDVASCFPASGAAQMNMRGYAGCRLDSVGGRPLGLLFVLFRGPVAQPEFVVQTIRIFASRAGAELERQTAHAHILEQASLLDKAKDAIVMHDAANRITFWNKGAERLYGLSAEDVLGAPVDEVLHDNAGRDGAIRTHLAECDEWQGEVVRRRGDGSEMTLEINSTLVRNTRGEPGSVLSIITDITRRKAAEREVAKLAYSDHLTGLPNRVHLERQLQSFLAGGAQAGIDGALLWIDLDHLKSLNDTRGHDMGDLLLRQTGERIASAIGGGDVPARFGGDEFVVLMTDPSMAIEVARELLARLSQPYDLDGHMHSGSASIGLAYFRCDQDAATEIFKRADIAMYEAKSAGRNTLRIFDSQMQEAVNSRVELLNDLRRALCDQAFHLVYQPQVSEAGCVTAVEALLRWNHPVRGPVSPAQFIPVAESSGLIIGCGEWVLDQACTQLKRWESHPHARSLSIAVNVSAHQIRHPGFVDQVMAVLRRTGADARKLKLELTESSLVADTEATVEKMEALRAAGIRFSLDDFGTGFSSLSYLRRLPLDQLKIDRSFVCDAVADSNAAVITRSIIALGKSLGLEVIAEGVETLLQRDFLASHGCTMYQGYLFSKPVGMAALEDYLRQSAQQRCAVGGRAAGALGRKDYR